MARRRRLSVWGVLRKLGHPLRGGDSALRIGCPDDRDAVIQHVFETVGGMSVSSSDGDVAAGTPEVLHYLHDVLGSVVALTNASGVVVERYDYDPYGKTYITDSSLTTYRGESKYGNPFMWTGQAFDQNTRQYHFWARAYSPHLGRWLQRDPLRYVDGVGLYEYAISDPVGFVDPAGLRIDKVVVYLPRSGFYRVYLHVYDSQGNYLDTVVIKNPNDDHEVAEAEQVAHWIETGGLISDGADIAETAAYASLFVGGLFIPGPDDAIWALVLGEQGIQLVAKGAGYVLVRGGKVLSELEARLAIRGAAGKVEKLAANSATKNRVTLRKGVKEQIEAKAPRDAQGRPIDPNTGKPIDGKPDIGHKPGEEWRKRKKAHDEKGSTRKEVIEAENDPDLYQLEDPSSNRSHKHECPGA